MGGKVHIHLWFFHQEDLRSLDTRPPGRLGESGVYVCHSWERELCYQIEFEMLYLFIMGLEISLPCATSTALGQTAHCEQRNVDSAGAGPARSPAHDCSASPRSVTLTEQKADTAP